jgi:hypothetical protein
VAGIVVIPSLSTSQSVEGMGGEAEVREIKAVKTVKAIMFESFE